MVPSEGFILAAALIVVCTMRQVSAADQVGWRLSPCHRRRRRLLATRPIWCCAALLLGCYGERCQLTREAFAFAGVLGGAAGGCQGSLRQVQFLWRGWCALHVICTAVVACPTRTAGTLAFASILYARCGNNVSQRLKHGSRSTTVPIDLPTDRRTFKWGRGWSAHKWQTTWVPAALSAT